MERSPSPSLPSFLVLLLAAAGSGPQAAAAGELAAAARHAPADGGAVLYRLEYRPGAGAPAGSLDETAFRALDRPEAYFVKDPSPPPAGSTAAPGTTAMVFRLRGTAPREFEVEHGGERQRFTVDWSAARASDALPAAWREAARRHFESLAARDDLGPFARYALSRLEEAQAAGAGAQGAFLRAQDIARRDVSTFDLTTGAVAIEESLQLERLRGTGRNRSLKADVPLRSVEGVAIRAHPWEEMLAGRSPEPHPIERFLPLDQYAFEAASFAEFLALLDWLDAWGSPLLMWMDQSADDAGVKERLERQLCLGASALARLLGPAAIGRVAATGGDPFLREGSDLTLIFELKAPALFGANLEKNRLAALAEHPGARRVEEEHHGHKITGLVDSERTVSSYSVEVEGHALVSNSLAGLRRALDAAGGRVSSQRDGLDRRYVRTLLPRGPGEGGFIFLSDPAIRRLVGPELKLRESRRLECAASLRTIAHAAAWRRVLGEPAATAVDDLIPAPGAALALWCPDGGSYSLRDRGRAGACGVHGSLDFLTPNAELALELITTEEKEAYDRFRSTYQSYWSRFFDPIGIQAALGKTKRFETVILPLIEMSEYREIADLFGGEGTQQGAFPEIREGTSVFVGAHLNPKSRLFGQAETFGRSLLAGSPEGVALGWVGERASIFLEDAPADLKLAGNQDVLEQAAKALIRGAPGGVRVAVRNPILLAGFLGAVRSMVLAAAPGVVEFQPLPERNGVSLVRVSAREGFGGDVPDALHYGVIGDGLYLGLDQGTLERVAERHAAAKTAREPAKEPAAEPAAEPAKEPAKDDGPGDAARAKEGGAAAPGAAPASWIDGSHLALALNLAGSPRWRALVLDFYERGAAELCARSARRLDRLERLGAADPAGERLIRAAASRCPLGGDLRREGGGRHACSLHGEGAGAPGAAPPAPLRSPLRSLAEARVRLTFTPEGVRTMLELREEDPGR
jgi:hypothetical protein